MGIPDAGKFGIVTSDAKQFHDGEPIFILRASDPLACWALMRYADHCEMDGVSPKFVQQVRDRGVLIKHWQIKNPGLVKSSPD